MKKNGYLGYNFSIGQNIVDDPQLSSIEKLENDKGNEGMYEVKFKYEINHLDWKSIKEGESEEVFDRYRRGLGVFIALTNKAS